MAKVFVSYSRKDIEFAKRLTTELQKSELDFWIDWEGIPPTVDWWREIEKGIEEADVFLFLISSDSSASKVCGKEIDCAVKNAKRIIPLVVRDIKGDEAPKQLSHLNWIFFREGDDFDAALKKLMTAIQTDYEWAATHRRLQVKALDWERNNKDNGFLLRGRDLQDAELDLATNTSKDPHPTDLQREYVFESRKATDRQRRITTGVSITAAIALAALAIFGFYQANVATRQATISRSGELAAQSISLVDRNFQNSLLLAIESYRKDPNVLTKGVLLDITKANPQLRQIIAVQNDIKDIDLSPDGKTLAINNYDGTVTFWSTVTGLPTRQLHSEDLNSFNNITYSPDGKMLAAGGCGEDTCGVITLWDTQTLESIRLELIEGSGSVIDTVFSPDGKMLVSLDGYPLGTQSVVLWDLKTEPITGTQITPNGSVPLSIAFSPDSKFIAIGDSQNILGSVHILNAESLQPIESRIPIGLNDIINITYSHNGKVIASTHRQGYVALWNLSGDPTNMPLDNYSDALTVVFSPDGKLIASGNNDGTINLWNSASPYESVGQPLSGHADGVSRIFFSRDGKTLASLSGNSVFIWDLNSVQLTIGHILAGQTGDDIAFTREGDIVISGSRGGTSPTGTITPAGEMIVTYGYSSGTVTTWNVSERKQIGQLIAGDILAFSPDDKSYISIDCTNIDINSGCTKFEAVLREVTTGNSIGNPFIFTEDPVTAIFSPNGESLAFRLPVSEAIILWNPLTGKQLRFPGKDIKGFSHEGKTLVFSSDLDEITLRDVETGGQIGNPIAAILAVLSPDGKTLASTNGDGIITLWNAETGERILKPFTASPEHVIGMAFNPNGNTLAFHDGKRINLLDVTAMKLIGRWEVPYSDVITFSPNGNILTTSSSLGTPTILWNIKTRKRITDTGSSYPIVFSPNSDTFVSRDYLGAVTLWDSTSGKPIGQPIKGIETIFSWAFSPDGKTLAVGVQSGILLMDVDPEKWVALSCERAGRNLTRAEWAQYFPNEDYRKTCKQWPLEEETISTPTPESESQTPPDSTN